MHQHQHTEEHLGLRLPVRARSVPLGRRAVVHFAEDLGFPRETLWRVRLALSEALSNVVLHAHEAEQCAQAHLELRAEADATQLTLTVTDEGKGLHPRTDSPGMGLGLSLIACSCDALELDTTPAGGTVVRMTFLR